MKRLAWLVWGSAWAVVVASCGGTLAPSVDGGSDGGVDAAADAGGDAGCIPSSSTACTTPCPSGTVCLQYSFLDALVTAGCVQVPAACNGTPTCSCMAPSCFCHRQCFGNVSGDTLTCNNGTVSRRAFKKDIDYVTDAQRSKLADETLAMRLATYRYKTEAPDEKKHLGFLIDDQPQTSPAVMADGMHVDEYGYASMLLATLQAQQKRIDALSARVETLEHACRTDKRNQGK